LILALVHSLDNHFLRLALMIMPPDDATTLHNAIPNSVTDGEGNFAVPCSTNSDLAVVFGGTSFSISPKDYVGAPLGTDALCQSNIVGQTVGNATQWLSGDVFLKNVTPPVLFSRTMLTSDRCMQCLIMTKMKLGLVLKDQADHQQRHRSRRNPETSRRH
jgi:Eukaryotic aspartyl protease